MSKQQKQPCEHRIGNAFANTLERCDNPDCSSLHPSPEVLRWGHSLIEKDAADFLEDGSPGFAYVVLPKGMNEWEPPTLVLTEAIVPEKGGVPPELAVVPREALDADVLAAASELAEAMERGNPVTKEHRDQLSRAVCRRGTALGDDEFILKQAAAGKITFLIVQVGWKIDGKLISKPTIGSAMLLVSRDDLLKATREDLATQSEAGK